MEHIFEQEGLYKRWMAAQAVHAAIIAEVLAMVAAVDVVRKYRACLTALQMGAKSSKLF